MRRKQLFGDLLADPRRFAAMATLIATLGALSGGCLERDIIERALRLTTDSDVVRYDTSSKDDRIRGSGSSCNGAMTVRIVKITVRVLEQTRDVSRNHNSIHARSDYVDNIDRQWAATYNR